MFKFLDEKIHDDYWREVKRLHRLEKQDEWLFRRLHQRELRQTQNPDNLSEILEFIRRMNKNKK